MGYGKSDFGKSGEHPSVEWADLWRHPSSMSRAGRSIPTYKWSQLNV